MAVFACLRVIFVTVMLIAVTAVMRGTVLQHVSISPDEEIRCVFDDI